ncbi:dynein axonemal heavy chain 7-like [Phymastichus coffea]|uniref:dynein axonemal heavy chain 7-like n=1 Tax=Phymastichus coffea TaxID=108790 RepID=UPI00273ADD2C|nr:dynein axonemal heavy chain 7-like [Phymastichus coffea]
MSERLEFYKLINDKTKVPRLTPIPKLELTNKEHKVNSPLHKFRAGAKKLVKSTRQSDLQACRAIKMSDKWKQSINLVTRAFYTEQLIKLAQTIGKQSLQPEWEMNIHNLIPEKSRNNHRKYLEALMKEVKQDYQDTIQQFNIKSIVNAREEDSDAQIVINYSLPTVCNEQFRQKSEQFEEHRTRFEESLFLSHRLIGVVFNKYYFNEINRMQMFNDESLINFSSYRTSEPLFMAELIAKIKCDLKQSCNIHLQCYKKIIEIIRRYENEPIKFMKNKKRLKSDLEIIQEMKILEINGKLPKILHCAEHFMIRQILKFIKNSINNLIEMVKDSGSCAQLKMHLICRNNTLVLDPSVDTIFANYHGIVDDIMNVVQIFVQLGQISRVKKSNPFMKIEVPEWFSEKAHLDLQEVLERSFNPLLEHYAFVCERFNVLCSVVTKKQTQRLIGKKKNFEVYCAEINKFNAYLSEINTMVEKVYYNFGVLNQTPAINDLKRCTSEIIDMLVNELVDNHQELNFSICTAFENLENRALSIPDDTKSLFELTDYVSYASKVLVKNLEKKIQKSVLMLTSLIDIALLSDEHIELNKCTINWLELIKPVFSQHNIFCEAKKGELEDELQRKINVLNADIDAIFPELVIMNDMDDTKRVFEYREFLAAILTKIYQIDNQIESINCEEKLFKFPETTFPKVDEIKEVMHSFCSLIHVIYQWQKDYEVWMDGPFEYLDANLIEMKTTDYFTKITEMHKTYKVKIKSDLTSNKPFKFLGTVDDPDPLQQPAPLKLCWQALRDLNEFKRYVSLTICMCNPALEKRHWDEMSSIAGINLLPNAGTTLRKIIGLGLLNNFEKYEVISIGANKELALQKKLNDMIDEWKNINLSISRDDMTEKAIFTDENEIDILLEEQFVKIIKIRASHFVTPIESKILEFHNKLCYVRETIECWNCIQKHCENMNLYFSNETVQIHLEKEVNLYTSLEQILKSIEESLNANPTFNYITRNSSILDKLKKGKYALEFMSSKMQDYLNKLRLSFPRLFFLSDDEVVQLLFVCQNITHSKLHLKKCFPNIVRVNMGQDLDIISIVGDSGEEVLLEKAISLKSSSENITDWLVNVKTEVTNVIKSKLNSLLHNFTNELSIQWITQTPAMVIYCIWQIYWTTQVHRCFNEANMEILKAKSKMCKSNAQELLKSNLSKKDREIVTSLIILFIHQEEVASLLIDKKIHDQSDFDWKAQVRYYYCNISDEDECNNSDDENVVKVEIINSRINYAYEYYSSCQRISVNTPLTARCYRNLMEAYHYNYFGAIAGFPCVGKTETIMNLARILATPFFMFNGEDQLNYNYISNVFRGLVSFEAWVFVKNFTKIDEEILSVIAQYIFRISQLKTTMADTINIEGTQLTFNLNCYLTFSINLSSSRLSPVPDNLKIHFRTVSFMNPDLKKICQVELFAAGFQDAENLADLLVQVYTLCSEQLSVEKKYNFKLSNLKSIVKTAAKLKFVYPEEEEKIIILRVVVDINISQFIGDDIIIFESILEQCFPSVVLPPTNHDHLLEVVKNVCAAQQLSVHSALKLKVIQLYEMIHLKQAIILVGETYSGKSTILHVLMESLLCMNEQDNQNNNKINYEVINPGALDNNRMYGFVDELSGKWNDGICPDILRRFKESDEQNWLIFDSNMHVSWVEKLETVLNESRTLYLTSSEKIILSSRTKIFFETENLEDVSPVTVSRCGIVYMNLQKLGWRPFVLADLTNVEYFQGYHQIIYKLFDWSIDPCLEFMQKNCSSYLRLTDMHLVISTLSLFKMYMNYAIDEHIEKKEKDNKDHIAIWSQAAIIMATLWTLTGSMNYTSRDKFEEFYMSLWSNSNENFPRPNEIKQFEISLPNEGKLYDNIYIFKGSGYWKHCGEMMKTEKIKEENLYFQEAYIPTTDSVKLTALLNLHVKYRRPFLLIGSNCCGKTSFIKEFLANIPRSEYISNYFYFNSNATTNNSQKRILTKLNKIKQYNYGPSKNRHCINFIDDLNVILSKRGMNSTLELIRQHIDYGFWYDLKGVNKINILDTMFAGIFSTERDLTDVCSRFSRHFNIFAMYDQSKDNVFRIFSNTLLIDLKKNSFTADVQSSVNSIVNASVEIYLATVQKLKPTPLRALYHFSLRDVRRIIKGCSLIQKESVETKITFIRLWAHETYRVLSDRITNDEDKQWFFVKMREVVKLCFKDPFESVFDHLPKYENELTVESFNNLAFGNLMDQDSSKRKYEEISTNESFKNKLLQYVKEYNETSKYKIDIVLTCHALQNLIKICRILATPEGTLLMISSNGSGRRSLTRLAAFIEQQKLCNPIINDYAAWKNDLKSIMINCGTKKKDVTFFMTDRQLKPEVMQDVKNFLSHNEIPGLFDNEEQRMIIKQVRLDAQRGNRNLEMNMTSVLAYFLSQCRQRLHFVLNISPFTNTLQKYLHRYPFLLEQCTINWFDYWPEKALEQVASHYLKDVNILDSIKCQIILASKHFYNYVKEMSLQHYIETGKMFYVMPSSFVRTAKLYASIISKKQEEIKSTKKRYIAGLEKLKLTADEVAQMKNTLTKLRPQLEASARQTEATMKEIENENISVEKATVLVKRDEEIANKKAEIAGILKAECEAELAVAIPILEDALAALNTLKPTDITLVKAMKNPPDTVKLVMAAVCVMLSVPSERVVDPITGRKSMDFWGPSKRVLGDMNFLQNLKDYDKDNISPTIIVTIKKTYMTDKNFMPQIVAKASSAAEGLCKWVRAMVSYDEVAKVVAPKKEKLAAAQKECDETEAFLNTKRKTLADLNAKLAALRGTLEATLLKKLELEREVENCTIKLRKAESLIASLGGEKTRWFDAADKLGNQYNNLPGDVLLSSATVTYLSSLSLIHRQRNISKWKGYMIDFDVSCSKDFDFIQFMGVEMTINTWHLCGLSNNKFSLQNAIIMDTSPLWCLFIDPQTQAFEWIKNMEKPNNLHVLAITDSNYISTIRNCMEIGEPVLLKNLDKQLDISLDPILNQDIYQLSESWYINLGQDTITYNPNFRLYLTTRHHKHCYSADVFNKVTVIDFLLPSDALRDRLLDIVIFRERPELQEKFEKVLMENINIKRILKQQEDNILHTLSASTTNILEDEGAIKTLDNSKKLAIDLMKRHTAAKKTKEDIDQFRETYSPFTKYCADLYSTLNLLPNLNHMYRFSLSWFTQLYIKSIETSHRSVVHKKRIDYLKMSSIQNLYQSIQNALFEKHKLIYSFILSAKTLLDTEKITEQEFNIFMSIGEKSSTEFEVEANPASPWLPEESWREICKISLISNSNSLTAFHGLTHNFASSNTKWKRNYTSRKTDCSLPAPWDNKLTSFQKLILIRILWPDKIISKVTEFVESVMGSNNNIAVCNITRPYQESTCLVPLIFILPSYSSPFAIVNRFAKISGYSTKLHSLSLGPLQGQKAELLIEIARKNGEWVFLHNCHLALSWMAKLEKICENFDITNTSLGFRLWMTTQSSDDFPIGLLQNSIKIAFDSPQDIKQTLTWTYKSEPVKDKEFFEGCPGKDKAFSRLLYSFCLFHTVIRERKNFGIQSWNDHYDFDESDLHMSIIQLQNWVNQCEKVPYKALTYVLSECNYGAKIINVQDKIFLDSLVTEYCNSKVVYDLNYDFDTMHAYKLPKRIEYKDYIMQIKNIPNDILPFFRDQNLVLIKNSHRVENFLNSLSCLNETAVIHNIEIESNQVQSIIFQMIEKLPSEFNVEEVQHKYKITKLEPLNYVLLEEINYYNKYLSTIKNSLVKLKRAYDGYTPWTLELENLAQEIFQQQVPSSWRFDLTFCITKLPKFILNLLERIKFISSWIINGHPQYYWFGGLISCKRLLSTLKMTFARKKQVPMNQVAFEFSVLDKKSPNDSLDVPDNCIYVYGLYLVGAKWNDETKSLSSSDTNNFYNEMPVVSFALTLKNVTTSSLSSNSAIYYKCPLYVTSTLHNNSCNSETLQDNYILSVDLRTDINPRIWIKRGTALYCQVE